MNKRYIIAPLVLALALTGCKSLKLTDDQKETVATIDNKIGEAVEEATQQLEDSVEIIGNHKDEIKDNESGDSAAEASTSDGILNSTSDIALTDTDGNGKNYTFNYDGQSFEAVYTPDKWKVYDSYKITSETDITIICQALIDVHQVHGKDMASYRTAEDMAYEWLVHNTAYMFLPDGNELKAHAKDVDLDPRDQGRTLEEIYEDRTGKELTMDTIMEYMQQNTGE